MIFGVAYIRSRRHTIPQLCWVIVHTHSKSTSDSRGNRALPGTLFFAHRGNGPPMMAAFAIPILMVIVVVIAMAMVDAGVEAGPP